MSSNRTSLESKLYTLLTTNLKFTLLIAPVWNRNVRTYVDSADYDATF